MKKKMSKMMVCVCVLTGLLFGCAGSQRLSDNFDEAEVKAAAESVIEILNSGEVELLVDEQWNAVMKGAADVEIDRKSVV